MTIVNQLVHTLYRPLFITVSCLFLNACGGDSLMLANGIGGTGITTIGRITAFGSVYVNGIHYNTDAATFSYNGKTVQQDDLYLGNIVQVKGTIHSDKKTGVAELVTYADTLNGPVTLIADGKIIEIMKQSVVTNDLTVFHGFRKLTDLNVDNIVEVSGFSTSDGKIKASSIRLINENYVIGTELELEGFISDIDQDLQTFSVQDLTINYAQSSFTGITADALETGLYLVITTNQDIQKNTLIASSINVDNQLLIDGKLYEIEGLVTSFTSPTLFSVDDLPVITNSQTEFTPSSQGLTKGSYVRVFGTSNAQGRLVADAVTVMNLESETVLETTLQFIDLAERRIEILGQTAEINASTLLLDDRNIDGQGLSLEDFAVGDSVLVVTWKDSNGQLTVVRLSKVETLTDTFILGLPENVDIDNATLTLFNQTIHTGTTEYIGTDQTSISQAAFFNGASSTGTDVAVTGQVRSVGTIDASRLELLDYAE